MPLPVSLAELLSPVSQAVFECGEYALDFQRQSSYEFKPDGSVVTPADVEVEARLRKALTAALPGSSMWGEENGRDPISEVGHWLVDPIDGTTNYAMGLPQWGVSVGLYQNGSLVLGVISLPASRELYAAVKDQGAQLNGKPLAKVRPGPVLPFEPISIPENLLRKEPNFNYPGKARLFGSSVFNLCSFASGRIRVHYGYAESLYDIAAGLVIAREAGGKALFTSGEAFDESVYASGHPIDRPWKMEPLAE